MNETDTLALEIKHLPSGTVYRHYFMSELCQDMATETPVRRKLAQFLQQMAEKSKETDNWSWDHAAYNFAASKISSIQFPSLKHYGDWSIRIEHIKFEVL